MKTTLALCGILAGILLPLSAHADPESVQAGEAVGRARKPVSAQSDHATVYITSRVATGSHLPLVVRRYHGEYTSMSPSTVYGRPDLDRTGQLSVAGELLQREPAISSAPTHR